MPHSPILQISRCRTGAVSNAAMTVEDGNAVRISWSSPLNSFPLDWP